jgi:hypothetical protein
MLRPLVVVSRIASLLPGCAAHQNQLPAGQDPQALVDAIALRGQGGGPAEPAPARFQGRTIAENVSLIARLVFVMPVYCLTFPFWMWVQLSMEHPAPAPEGIHGATGAF